MSEILRRVTAAASVTTFFLASVTTFLLASCGSNSSQPTYDAAIQEGQTAAQDLINTGAWHLYDPEFKTVASGKGNAATSLPAGNGLGYLTLFGDPGQTITVAVQ